MERSLRLWYVAVADLTLHRAQLMCILLHFSLTSSLYPDVQAIADSLDNVPHFVAIHTDHNARCNNANHVLRVCKNHVAENERHAFAASGLPLM